MSGYGTQVSWSALEWLKDFGPRCMGCDEASLAWLCKKCSPRYLLKGLCSYCLHDYQEGTNRLCNGEGTWHCKDVVAGLYKNTVAGLCLVCQHRKRPFENLWISFRYESAMASFIKSFKNQYPERLRELNFKAMLAPLPRDYLAVVPMPSDPRRLQKVGFNSSKLLGERIARSLGISFEPDLLSRRPFLAAQKEMTLEQRQRFLSLQLYVSDEVRRIWTGKRVWANKKSLEPGPKVLLVDDIMTTGASVEIGARLLKQLGLTVDVYCLSRALKKSKVAS